MDATHYRIEPLAGAQDWPVWKVRLTNILTVSGLWGYVSGSSKCPEALSDSEAKADAVKKTTRNSEIEKWKENDRKALSTIRMRVSDEILNHVPHATTSEKAWSTLEKTYEAKGALAVVQIRRKLFRARCEEGQDIAEFVCMMNEHRDELRTLQQVSEADFSMCLLAALPESWNTFIATIDYRTTLSDSSEIIARILDEGCRVKAWSAETALCVKAQRRPGGKKEANSFECRKPGYQKDCPNHGRKGEKGQRDIGSREQKDNGKTHRAAAAGAAFVSAPYS